MKTTFFIVDGSAGRTASKALFGKKLHSLQDPIMFRNIEDNQYCYSKLHMSDKDAYRERDCTLAVTVLYRYTIFVCRITTGKMIMLYWWSLSSHSAHIYTGLVALEYAYTTGDCAMLWKNGDFAGSTLNPCTDEGVRGKSPKLAVRVFRISRWRLRKSLQKKVECVIWSILSSLSNMLSDEYKQLDVWKYINANHAFHTKQHTDIYICKI